MSRKFFKDKPNKNYRFSFGGIPTLQTKLYSGTYYIKQANLELVAMV